MIFSASLYLVTEEYLVNTLTAAVMAPNHGNWPKLARRPPPSSSCVPSMLESSISAMFTS